MSEKNNEPMPVFDDRAARREEMVTRFEDAWFAGGKPEIDEYLSGSDPERLELLLELILVDVELRVKAGQDVRVEAYVERYPELRDDTTAVLDLISTEYQFRRRWEPNLSVDEYLERFQPYRQELAKRLTQAAPSKHETPFRDDTEAARKPCLGRDDAPRETTDLAALQIPHVLGDYEILERLGGGGMGDVYKARHRRLKKLVAVKVLKSELTQSSEALRRFAREMEAVGRLSHANIVSATDAREEAGLHFLVMEYVEGADVAELICRRGQLPVADACEIVRQTAVALQHAYQKGLIHRDIKPSNLMLTPEGDVKLLDLGLARLRHKTPAGGETTIAGQTLGTPDYVAPEQARGDKEVDIRADLYSLGCTLYHLLVGKPPFGPPEYATVTAKLAAHLHKPFPSIRSVRGDVSTELEAFLDRLTAKEPADRPGTPVEVIQALTPLAEGAKLPGLASDDVVPTATQDAVREKTATPHAHGLRGRPVIVNAALACIAVVCLALSAQFFLGGPSSVSEVSVRQATLWIRRNEDDRTLKKWILVEGSSPRELEFPPLGPRDDFKLHAEFTRPTHWYLVWFDTKGVSTVVAHSEQPETEAECPLGNQMCGVDPADPAGLHMLLLLASERGADEVQPAALQARLADVGAPPNVVPEQYMQLRGAGPVKSTSVNLDPDYSRQIENRLPEGVHWVYQLYLPTER